MKFKLIVDPNAEEQIVVTVHAPSALTEQIEAMVLSNNGIDSLQGYCDGEITRLSTSEVECITIIDRKVIAIYKDGKHYRLSMRLFELEEQLPSYFFRINKSALANRHCIVKFKTTVVGGVDAHFRCGYVEYVSRRCFADIKRRMGL